MTLSVDKFMRIYDQAHLLAATGDISGSKKTIQHLTTYANIELQNMREEVRKIRDIENEKVWLIPPSVVCSIGKGAVLVALYPNYKHFQE